MPAGQHTQQWIINSSQTLHNNYGSNPTLSSKLLIANAKWQQRHQATVSQATCMFLAMLCWHEHMRAEAHPALHTSGNAPISRSSQRRKQRTSSSQSAASYPTCSSSSPSPPEASTLRSKRTTRRTARDDATQSAGRTLSKHSSFVQTAARMLTAIMVCWHVRSLCKQLACGLTKMQLMVGSVGQPAHLHASCRTACTSSLNSSRACLACSGTPHPEAGHSRTRQAQV
jgi:hypothetical protein